MRLLGGNAPENDWHRLKNIRAGNRDFALYSRIKARFEPITVPKTVIDTDQPRGHLRGKQRYAVPSRRPLWAALPSARVLQSRLQAIQATNL